MRKVGAEGKLSGEYANTIQGRLEAVDPRITALEGIGGVDMSDLSLTGHLDFESLCAKHSGAEGVFTIRDLIESHARLEETVRSCQAAFDLIMAACDSMGDPMKNYSTPSVIKAIGGYACNMTLVCEIEQDLSMSFFDELEAKRKSEGTDLAELLGLDEMLAKMGPLSPEEELRELVAPQRRSQLPFLSEDGQRWCLPSDDGEPLLELDTAEDAVRVYCREARTRYRYERRGSRSFLATRYTLSWEDLLGIVLRYPESFYIPEGAEADYSPQELRAIANLQAQLLRDGAKDNLAENSPARNLERLEKIFRMADAQCAAHPVDCIEETCEQAGAQRGEGEPRR